MLHAIGETGVHRIATEMEIRLARVPERPFANLVVEIEQRRLTCHFGGWLGGDQTARWRGG
jgi:hypothetical protein